MTLTPKSFLNRVFLIGSFFLSPLAQANAEYYIQNCDELLVNVVQSYRESLEDWETTRSNPSKTVTTSSASFLRLSSHLQQSLTKSDHFDFFFSTDGNLILTDPQEQKIIQTLLDFGNYLRAADSLHKILEPDWSASQSSYLSKFRTKGLTKSKMAELSSIFNQSRDFTIFKPAILRMFYQAGSEHFDETFLGVIQAPMRALAESYFLAKLSDSPSTMSSFLNSNGFLSDRCALYKMELFQKWLSNAQAGRSQQRHSEKLDEEVEKEPNLITTENDQITSIQMHFMTAVGVLWQQLEPQTKRDKKLAKIMADENRKIKHFLGILLEDIKSTASRFNMFQDKQIVILKEGNVALANFCRSKAIPCKDFGNHYIRVTREEIRNFVKQTFGVTPTTSPVKTPITSPSGSATSASGITATSRVFQSTSNSFEILENEMETTNRLSTRRILFQADDDSDPSEAEQ